jgi:hypothetical protein
MLSDYEEVALPIKVPVGVYCYNSNEPIPVTCPHIDFEWDYPRCTMFIGNNLKLTENGTVFKLDECAKLRSLCSSCRKEN